MTDEINHEFKKYLDRKRRLKNLLYDVPFSINKYIDMLIQTGESANRYENAVREGLGQDVEERERS